MVKPADPREFEWPARSLSEFGGCDERVQYFVRGGRKQNFGDYLPEIFCKALLTFPKVEADAYRLVGSVIEPRWINADLSRANGLPWGVVAFWGCGARRETPLPKAVQDKCLFFGVRGPLTRDLLGLPLTTALGDPGLLAPLFHTPRPDAETQGKAICLAHVMDRKPRAEVLALSGAEIVVSPEIEASEAALRGLLDKIASASFVLTASLHGAIIACAYGRPFAFWDNGHVDAPFKWRDFAASIGVPCVFARDVEEGRELFRTVLEPTMVRPPLARMLEVCPFGVRGSVMLRALVYDGRVDAATVDQAASALLLMEATAEAGRRQAQDLSAETRRRQRSLKAQLERGLGLGVRSLARKLPRKAKLMFRG